ncbi:MAG: hypothetical protein IIC12_03575 [Proteobacteria bacterium]|nr:hypothetical protein [Pseudomonadota bacterium]
MDLPEHPNEHYVYVLKDQFGTPFYVGLGQGSRLFQHEEEAGDKENTSAKCQRDTRDELGFGPIRDAGEYLHSDFTWQYLILEPNE